MGKLDMHIIKFTVKNYSSWACQLLRYLKGKEMWRHISGSKPKPDEDKLEKWETKEVQVMSWILGSVDP